MPVDFAPTALKPWHKGGPRFVVTRNAFDPRSNGTWLVLDRAYCHREVAHKHPLGGSWNHAHTNQTVAEQQAGTLNQQHEAWMRGHT